MKNKKRGAIKRSEFSYLKVPLSIKFRLISQWDNPKTVKTIKGRGIAVSRTGLCFEAEIAIKDGVLRFSQTEGKERVKVLPYLVLSDKEIEVELQLFADKNKIFIRGKAIWYEFASEGPVSKLRIEVLFTDIPRETRDRWLHYIRHTHFLSPT